MILQVKKKFLLLFYISTWLVINLMTLITYPIMHSDEAWLAGLTQSMIDNGHWLITEPFFDLAPRAPHTLKLLFHLIQWPFIQLFGYDLFSVRLMSLVFGLLSLILLYMYLNQFDQNSDLALMGVVILSLTSPFIYAAHFARQESSLIFILILSLLLYNRKAKVSYKSTIVISSLIGLAISLHPNAFIIAVMIGSLYLEGWLVKDYSFKVILSYITPMALFALLNLIVTFTQTKNFLAKYWQYASTLSVGASPASRFENFLNFYLKIYQRITGTYYIANMKYLFILALIALVFLGITYISRRKTGTFLGRFLIFDTKKTRPIRQCLLMAIGFNVALFIIGRYNPTSIVFLVVIILLFLLHTTQLFIPLSIQRLLLIIFITISSLSLYNDYKEGALHDYDHYHQFLASNIQPTDIVLANLSGGFTMDVNQFYDIRNLNYLEDTSLEAYLLNNNINTIIYYEEYDYIHRNPEWQILYGDDAAYYDDLNQLIVNYGTLKSETISPYYGNRIIRYMGDYPWSIKIYALDLRPSD